MSLFACLALAFVATSCGFQDPPAEIVIFVRTTCPSAVRVHTRLQLVSSGEQIHRGASRDVPATGSTFLGAGVIESVDDHVDGSVSDHLDEFDVEVVFRVDDTFEVAHRWNMSEFLGLNSVKLLELEADCTTTREIK